MVMIAGELSWAIVSSLNHFTQESDLGEAYFNRLLEKTNMSNDNFIIQS